MAILLQLLFICGFGIATLVAEAPLRGSAPYPASGFRPRVPFNLPGEYLPPGEFGQQQQDAPTFDLEVTKERVDFLGQVQDGAFTNSRAPQTAYLPPNSNAPIFLKVQALPLPKKPQQFVKPRPQGTRQRQQFAPPQQQQQPQQFFPQQRPASQYGAPANDDREQINFVDPRTAGRQQQEQQQNDEDQNRATVETLSSALDAYNRASNNGGDVADYAAEDNNDGYPANNEATAPARSTQGQYYVLGPDNSLQRVRFTTSQDEEEARTNGFTAQLKYQPVGELNDPVFRYNNKGQLVRIVKK